MAEHGGSGAKYVHEGCRCNECVEANARRHTRRRRERRPEDYRGEHGNAAYSNWNCRCEDCVDAHSEKMRQNYLERKTRRAAQIAKCGDTPKEVDTSTKFVVY